MLERVALDAIPVQFPSRGHHTWASPAPYDPETIACHGGSLVGKIHMMKAELRERDPDLLAHSEAVARLTTLLVSKTKLGIPPIVIRVSAICHDIGKLDTPDKILFKPDKLTPEETRVMAQHASTGAGRIARQLSDADFLPFCNNNLLQARAAKALVVRIVARHHNRLGQEVDDASRMFAALMSVADSYRACREKRCYRDGLSRLDAAREIHHGFGAGQWPPEFERVFIEVMLEADLRESRDYIDFLRELGYAL